MGSGLFSFHDYLKNKLPGSSEVDCSEEEPSIKWIGLEENDVQR